MLSVSLYSFQVMFVNDEHFQTNSEMTSTGGNYLLFVSLNDIQLLNVSARATTDVTIYRYLTLTVEP